jgi:predicted nucleic acid-binding protein
VADALFDTSFFIDVRRAGHPGAVSLWSELLSGRITGAYSPVTVYELWVGQSMTREEEVFFETAFEILEEAPLTAEASRRAGFWLRGLARTTAEKRVRDALIAATADVRGEPVCTGNVRDFLRLGVSVRPYR